MADSEKISACVLVIGNEVLSGRTKDANLNWIASRCTEKGIRLAEARVIPDEEDVIVEEESMVPEVSASAPSNPIFGEQGSSSWVVLLEGVVEELQVLGVLGLPHC